jgi:hypothetical protein
VRRVEQSPPQGWYPDPSRRGSQRFWNGTRWTDQVRRVTGVRASRPGWLMPVIASGVVLVVVGAGLLIYGLNRAPDTVAAPLGAPLDTAAPAGPESPAAGSSVPSTDPAICAVGDPSYRGSHVGDGRLHGGGLVMPTPIGWTSGTPDRLSWAFDVGLAEAPGDAGWAALGAVRIEDPYSTPEQAGATITACLKELAAPETLRVTHSGPLTVPGADRSHEYSGRLQTEGRTQEFRVVVADVHSPESLASYVRVIDADSDQYAAVTAAENGLSGA